jgi:hypothetical protein
MKVDLAELREMLAELPASATTTDDGYVLDVDRAIAAVERGDVRPFMDGGATVELGLARALVWFDGPWWVPAA